MLQVRLTRQPNRGRGSWNEILPLDPRDPDIVRVKASRRPTEGTGRPAPAEPLKD
jgi:hypothetical protein